MDPSLTPSNRPRRGVLAVLGAGVAATLVGGAIVIGGSSPVEASGLSAFESCEELRDWGAEAFQAEASRYSGDFEEIGASIDDGAAADASSSGEGSGAGVGLGSGAPSTTAPATAMAEESDGSGGVAAAPEDGTNVIVEGIDEPDLVERLGGDRALVVGGQTLAVVDLGEASMLASARVPWGSQVTYDGEAGVAWAVGGGDDGRAVVQRFAVGESSLTEEGSWSTAGQVVSVRRQGGELLLVATDWFAQTFEGVSPGSFDGGAIEPDIDAVPFEGGPVPCDEVLHPQGPAEPTATMIVVLPAEGPVEPIRSTQVVGSGSNVHVTADAAYLATPSWDGGSGTPTTGLHRFDLASLTHTGSGQVEGALLNDFAMSEHDGHLRVALTSGGMMGIPMPIEGDGGIGDGSVGAPIEDAPVLDGPAESPMVDDVQSEVTGAQAPSTTTTPPPAPGPDVVEPDAAEPGDPAGTVPETTVPDGTTVPETTVPDGTTPGDTEPAPDEPMPVDPFPMPTMVDPPVGGEAVNEIVVLDTDGDLDVVGRTPRFGHPGETLHGIRFDGTVAYAVTFLQTDPFYVVDLADPTSPTILGELQLPGFSSYLHPISATEVVGFGPDENGRASAKLFDVSDRTRPRVVDSIVLGDDSPVAWDHHAFVSLGDDRFAVPANQWSYVEPVCDAEGCTAEEIGSPGVENHVVVLAVTGGRLVEEERIPVTMSESAMRVIPADGGWGLLASTELVVVDGGGSVRGTVPLG